MGALEGVVMELDDCAFPLLAGIEATSDLATAFDGTSWALLVGSVPRKAGMERGDLLSVNGGIFKPQGRAVAENAASDVRVLVVGNPCNTNCLIARSNASEVPADRWFAMTRLDENRAKSQLANKAGVQVAVGHQPGHLGQPLATQFPDFANARIGGKAAGDVIPDDEWLHGDFLTTVQKRGAAIIEARAPRRRRRRPTRRSTRSCRCVRRPPPATGRLSRWRARASTAHPRVSSSDSRWWQTAPAAGPSQRASSTTTLPPSALPSRRRARSRAQGRRRARAPPLSRR